MVKKDHMYLNELAIKRLKTRCICYNKNANKKNVNQRKNNNILSEYLPVESQQ